MSVSLRLKTVETAPKPPVVVRYRRPVDRRSKPRHLQDAVANRRDARSSFKTSRARRQSIGPRGFRPEISVPRRNQHRLG
jgi:hypothetical protein